VSFHRWEVHDPARLFAIGDLMSLFDFSDPHFAVPALPTAPRQARGLGVKHDDLNR